MDPKQIIIETIEALEPEMAATSRWLYEHPELSGEERESAELLAGRVSAHGFSVEMGVGGLATSFKATKATGADGARVAYLAEYDALPTVGHGCGHNIIGTVSTYAAIALAEALGGDLAGQIVLFGTPAEETDGGKIAMLEAGCFEGVSAAMMVHPSVHTELAYSSLACMGLAVEYHGRAAHAAASPWKGINALDAMIQLFVGIDMLKKQLPLTARAPGVILQGGERANIVPDYAKAAFSIRGKDKEEAEMVMGRVLDVARAAALSTGARMEHTPDSRPYYDMRPDARLVGLFRDAWAVVGGEEPVTHPVIHGSLDIGNLSHHFPCLHPSIRITEDTEMPGHSKEFADATLTPLATEQMVKAAKALALTGLGVLQGGLAAR